MAAFDFAKVKDPTFFKENVLNAHAGFRTYASREEYRTGSSSLAMKLDGIWKFAYAKNYTSAIPGFEKTDYDCSGWDDIHVPAHIQMEGYDIPQYANIQYPWDGREEVQPGEIPQWFNPVASYVKYFELPESMQGKPVHIEFEGVESGMALWLNGSYVGYTEDSFSAHAFDLTSYLQPGVNKLAVQVFKWTSSSWCEDQDFFRFSGIYRDVYLYTVPDTHAYDLQIRAIPEENLDVADLEVKVKTWGKGSIAFRLEKDGECVLEEKKSLTEASSALDSIEKDGIDVLVIEEKIDLPIDSLKGKCGIAYLVENSGIEKIDEIVAICKYQKAENIYKQILNIYSNVSGAIQKETIKNDKCDIITFSTPCGGMNIYNGNISSY